MNHKLSYSMPAVSRLLSYIRQMQYNIKHFRLTIAGICIPLVLYLICAECISAFSETSCERIRLFGKNAFLVSSTGEADLSDAILKLTGSRQPFRLTSFHSTRKGIIKYRYFKKRPVSVNLRFYKVSGDIGDGYFPYETSEGVFCARQKLLYGTWFPKETDTGSSHTKKESGSAGTDDLCLLEQSTAVLLTGTENAVGKYITYIDNNKYRLIRVCGVIEDLPDSSLENISLNRDCGGFFPGEHRSVTTDRRIYMNHDISSAEYSHYLFLFPDNSSEKGKQILSRLSFPRNVFACTDKESLIDETADTQTAVLLLSRALLFFLIVISGCMIMNTMRFSVYERIREIGIRRASGAGKREIALQFLFEGWFFAFYASLLSCTIASFSLTVISTASFFLTDMELHPILHLRSSLLVLMLSSLQTVLFSMQPALHAAGIQPVEALM